MDVVSCCVLFSGLFPLLPYEVLLRGPFAKRRNNAVFACVQTDSVVRWKEHALQSLPEGP